MRDSEQCSNRLERYLILLLVNFSCDLGQIVTRYDFLWVSMVQLRDSEQCSNQLELDLIHFWSTFHVNWANNDQI